MKLSKNFWLHEFEVSETAARKGIDNTIPTELIPTGIILCRTVLQPIRDVLGPVIITSGYRCPELNTAVGGSRNSAHMAFRAADIYVPGMDHSLLAKWIKAHIPDADKIILEFNRWVHVQIASEGREPRRATYTALREQGRTVYRGGIITA